MALDSCVHVAFAVAFALVSLRAEEPQSAAPQPGQGVAREAQDGLDRRA
jgi:hypothetical protein